MFDFDTIQFPMEHFEKKRAGTEMTTLNIGTNGSPLEKVIFGYKKGNVGPHYFVPQLTAQELKSFMTDKFLGLMDGELTKLRATENKSEFGKKTLEEVREAAISSRKELVEHLKSLKDEKAQKAAVTIGKFVSPCAQEILSVKEIKENEYLANLEPVKKLVEILEIKECKELIKSIEDVPATFKDLQLKHPNRVPVLQFVESDNRAWHAGLSAFADSRDVFDCKLGINSCAIGVAFHQPGYADGGDLYKYGTFTEGQKETAIELLSQLKGKYNIPANNLIADSSASVPIGRKTGPGPNFFWKELAANGLGYLPPLAHSDLPALDEENITKVQELLKKVGFIDCPQNGTIDENTQKTIDAYIVQFASYLWTGKANAITPQLLWSLEHFDAKISLQHPVKAHEPSTQVSGAKTETAIVSGVTKS